MLDQENKMTHKLVMLVDDSSIDNYVNQRVIQRYNFAEKVIEFTKAHDALRYLIKINTDSDEIVPALLFLDLDMPQINGYEFLDAYQLLCSRVKSQLSIVILSGCIDPAELEKCSTHAATLTMLPKPLMKHNLDDINSILLKKTLKLVTYVNTFQRKHIRI